VDKLFIHFTSAEDAEKIVASSKLLASSIVGGVYAIMEGGSFVPGVQKTALGRAKNRDFAVIFTTAAVPYFVFPEEAIWKADYVTLSGAVIVPAAEALSLLTDEIPESGFNPNFPVDIH
jgi:hypothetical protein